MSAIVAAAVELARVAAGKRAKASLGLLIDGMLAELYEQRLAAAGRAIVAASNAAGAGRVVEGAPRTWAVRWVCGPVMGWRPIIAVECLIFLPSVGFAADPDLRPTWLGDAWVWSTAAHDPRPCAWPRPFARGATP